MNTVVVIVTYNRYNLLKECIECVYNQTLKFSNVVIVDNACTDGTSIWLDSLNYDNLHIIHEETNGGGAKGFFDGVKFVHENLDAEWLLLIDDDAMLSSNYIEEIEKATISYPECKAFSGSVMTDGEIDLTHRKRIGGLLRFKINPVDLAEYGNHTFSYDLCSFCGLIFKTKLINKIGLPKADYFIWYDDSEYSMRIHKYSKIINVNSTYINHRTKIIKLDVFSNWRGYYGVRNSGDLIRTHCSKVQYYMYIIRMRLYQYKNWIISLFSKNPCYSYNSDQVKSALDDLQQNRFGFNPIYHP